MNYKTRKYIQKWRQKTKNTIWKGIISRSNPYTMWLGINLLLLKLWLTLLVPGKLKNSIFEMPIITQTLNINNLRTTSAKSINLHTIRKLAEYSFKNIWQRRCLFLPFLRYCCRKVGRYCDPPSGAQWAKGLIKFGQTKMAIVELNWHTILLLVKSRLMML